MGHRKWTIWATSAAMLGSLAVPTFAFASAPAPTLHQENFSGGQAGNWYTGAIPPNYDPSKPVILFVQGLHSNIGTWYNDSGDDYYDAAYNDGYRTAFVQLYDADGTGHDMWDNGWLLADVIQKVANYYNVPQINIVAHSKGGIDTQTALVWYGAYPYVNVVHQLSTPNLGSELADMAYSDWTWWLAALMGDQDDAVYSLQTSYMQWYRSITDPMTENDYTTTWLAAGTGDDGWFSAAWFAHPFLPGEDDGAVADYSALGLPNGYYSFVDDWWNDTALSHMMMVDASHTWYQVEPLLGTYNWYNDYSSAATANSMTTNSITANSMTSSTKLPAAVSAKMSRPNPYKNQPVDESSNSIMRGGAVNGTATDTFTLESGLKSAAIDIMTKNKDTNVTLISPSGKVYQPNQVAQQNQDGSILFADAEHHEFALPSPEKGTWTVKATGQNDAYFLLANLDGGAKAHVKAPKKVNSVNDPYVNLSITFDNGSVDKKHIKNAKLTHADRSGHTEKWGDVQVQPDSAGGLTATLATPATPGVYNLSFDVTGVNSKGETFTRSVNYNFAVTDANGKLK